MSAVGKVLMSRGNTIHVVTTRATTYQLYKCRWFHALEDFIFAKLVICNHTENTINQTSQPPSRALDLPCRALSLPCRALDLPCRACVADENRTNTKQVYDLHAHVLPMGGAIWWMRWKVMNKTTFWLPWWDSWDDSHQNPRWSGWDRPLSMCKVSTKSVSNEIYPKQTPRQTDTQTAQLT